MTAETDGQRDRFVSEPIEAVTGSFATGAMATGEPGLPLRFRWRDTEYEVVRLIEKWKTTGRCRNGSAEQYVRRHWYRIETRDGTQMRIYFDRQPRGGRSAKRWWLAAVSGP